MKFVIKHEIRGRLRVHFVYKNMTFRQADILQYYLMGRENIISSQIFNRTMMRSFVIQVTDRLFWICLRGFLMKR